MEPMREDGRRCLSVAEMQTRGWRRDRSGRWLIGANVREQLLERIEL